MYGNPGLLTSVLTVMSVFSLSLLSLLCLRCKRKSKVIHEERPTRVLQTFQRGGSIFAVIQSKPVTTGRPFNSSTAQICEEVSADAGDDQPDYENIIEVTPSVSTTAPHTGNVDHMYIAALPTAVYDNEQTTNPTAVGVYANICQTLQIQEDEEYYVNTDFSKQTFHKEGEEENEDDEPDYVNGC